MNKTERTDHFIAHRGYDELLDAIKDALLHAADDGWDLPSTYLTLTFHPSVGTHMPIFKVKLNAGDVVYAPNGVDLPDSEPLDAPLIVRG